MCSIDWRVGHSVIIKFSLSNYATDLSYFMAALCPLLHANRGHLHAGYLPGMPATEIVLAQSNPLNWTELNTLDNNLPIIPDCLIIKAVWCSQFIQVLLYLLSIFSVLLIWLPANNSKVVRERIGIRFLHGKQWDETGVCLRWSGIY